VDRARLNAERYPEIRAHRTEVFMDVSQFNLHPSSVSLAAKGSFGQPHPENL